MFTIKATPNRSKRTFTLRKYYNNKFYSKYRTFPMIREEFEELEYNTGEDWKIFLITDSRYVRIY
jgi:hypothetical protein